MGDEVKGGDDCDRYRKVVGLLTSEPLDSLLTDAM